jgi:hypothetical protein
MSRGNIPFVVPPQRLAPVRDDYAGTLILGDSQANQLLLAEFDSVFNILEVKTSAPVVLESRMTERTSKGQREPPFSPNLIGASGNQRTILLGNWFSRNVSLLRRDNFGLVRVGEFEMIGKPSQIEVSRTGKFAVLSYIDRVEISVLTFGSEEDAATSLPDRRESGRRLQRKLNQLGFPIGVVDGLIGPRTVAAYKLLAQKHGITVGLDQIEEAIAALENLPGTWSDAGFKADWSGRDLDCTPGSEPVASICTGSRRGMVAVCWENRPSEYPFNRCEGHKAWCTYKSVTIGTAPDGGSIGDVYVCLP